MKTPKARIAFVSVDVEIEFMDSAVGRARSASKQLDVVIGHWITALIERSDHELLPLLHLVPRLLSLLGGAVDPLSERCGAGNLQRAVYQTGQQVARIGQDRPMVLS